jgi:TRAP-type C4-dicarboxylate transport system substrate-binding protein
MQKTVFAFAFIAAGCAAATAASAQTTFRYDTWISPKHGQNAEVIPAWSKMVEEATQGRVKIAMSYPPNVNPATFFDRVTDGISDIAWGFHGYNPGRFVLTQIVELPGLDADAERASVAYQRIQERFLDKAGEHKGIKLVHVFAHGPGVLHSRAPVTNIDQMKGLKVRNGGGIAAEISNALGFVQVPAPASKVYEIVSQGVADGALMSIEVQMSFKLKEIARHVLVQPGGFYNGSFFVGMNLDKFNKLSKADQAAIDRVSGETLSRLTGKVWDKSDMLGLEEAKAAGNTITMASPELAKHIREKLAGIERDWIEKASKKGIDANAALKALRDEVKKLKTKS